MAAPSVTFTYSGAKISRAAGYDYISVSFETDIDYTAFECRATKSESSYGVGVGELVASFSYTPGETPRSFEIYDDYLTSGDGEYRISLYVQGRDGSWNDNHLFVPSGSTGLVTADGKSFLCMRGD